MKLKKIIRKSASFATVFALNLGIILSYAPAASAEMTADEIRDEISRIEQENEERRDQISQLEGDISEQKESLDEVAAMLGEQKQLVDYYNNLVYYKNEDVAAVRKKIDSLESDISAKDEAIKSAEQNIVELDKENEENLEKFAQIIRTMYTSGNSDMLSVIAGSSDFYSLMVSSEVVGNITEKNLEFMNSLKADIEKLHSDKKQLETDKKNLLEVKQALEDEKQVLEEEQADLQKLVDESSDTASRYESDYNNYQSVISDLESKQNDLSYLISVSEADIDSYEEQLRQLIIQQTQPDKTYQEGEWIWPVPGRGYISCYFGWDYDLGRWHKGIDIGDAGIYGDSILASKGGTVIVAESSYIPGYSYGMYVVVDHGGGYTSTYAHMSGVNVYVGQEVAQGDVLGFVGNTGYSFGSHLHFEIRVDGDPQNPFDYVVMA